MTSQLTNRLIEQEATHACRSLRRSSSGIRSSTAVIRKKRTRSCMRRSSRCSAQVGRHRPRGTRPQGRRQQTLARLRSAESPLEAHDLAKAVHSDKILNEAKVGFRARRPLAAWQSLGESVNPNATSNWLSRLAVPGAARSTAHRPCSLGQRQVRHACAGASECCLHRTAYAVTRPHLRNRPRLRLSGQLSRSVFMPLLSQEAHNRRPAAASSSTQQPPAASARWAGSSPQHSALPLFSRRRCSGSRSAPTTPCAPTTTRQAYR